MAIKVLKCSRRSGHRVSKIFKNIMFADISRAWERETAPPSQVDLC